MASSIHELVPKFQREAAFFSFFMLIFPENWKGPEWDLGRNEAALPELILLLYPLAMNIIKPGSCSFTEYPFETSLYQHNTLSFTFAVTSQCFNSLVRKQLPPDSPLSWAPPVLMAASAA